MAPPGRPVVLVRFSGGAAFASGLLLSEPDRFAGAAILYGTLPFDAGAPVTPARLAGGRCCGSPPSADLSLRTVDVANAARRELSTWPGVDSGPSAISVPGARAFVVDRAEGTSLDAFLVPRAGEFAHPHPG